MDLVLVFVAGFLAAGVDGALGMGFGPTAAAVLLASGMSPQAVSTTVNLAKTGAGVAAGIAHWRFDNVDRGLLASLALPGAIGAIAGATVLTRVDGDTLRPVIAVGLLLVGVRILWRFTSIDRGHAGPHRTEGFDRGVAVVGVAGGCTNGMIGAWGPVVTPYLLHRGVPPRLAVGSVNTAEVAVAVVALGTLLQAGGGSFRVDVAMAMLGGGVLAAPVAAWTVTRIPAPVAGVCLATMLLLTQTRELATAAGLGSARWLGYLGVVVGVAVVSARATRRRERAVRADVPGGSR